MQNFRNLTPPPPMSGGDEHYANLSNKSNQLQSYHRQNKQHIYNFSKESLINRFDFHILLRFILELNFDLVKQYKSKILQTHYINLTKIVTTKIVLYKVI